MAVAARCLEVQDGDALRVTDEVLRRLRTRSEDGDSGDDRQDRRDGRRASPRSLRRMSRGQSFVIVDRVNERIGVARASGRYLGQHPLDQHRCPDGQIGPNDSDRWRRLRHVPRDDRARRRRGERWRAGQHLVQHAPERVDVAAAVDVLFGARLLGAHVGWRA